MPERADDPRQIIDPWVPSDYTCDKNRLTCAIELIAHGFSSVSRSQDQSHPSYMSKKKLSCLFSISQPATTDRITCVNNPLQSGIRIGTSAPSVFHHIWGCKKVNGINTTVVTTHQLKQMGKNLCPTSVKLSLKWANQVQKLNSKWTDIFNQIQIVLKSYLVKKNWHIQKANGQLYGQLWSFESPSLSGLQL